MRAVQPSAAFVAAWQAVSALDVAGVTADSRQVVPGDLFFALPGNRADGRAFIADAVERGAVAVLAPPDTVWPPGVPPRPLIRDPEPRRRLAQIAAALAGPQPDTLARSLGPTARPARWSSCARSGPRAVSLPPAWARWA